MNRWIKKLFVGARMHGEEAGRSAKGLEANKRVGRRKKFVHTHLKKRSCVVKSKRRVVWITADGVTMAPVRAVSLVPHG